MDDSLNYQKLRNDALVYYNTIGSVFSPALNFKVTFTAEGFNHIVFTNPRSERERSSQIARFKLLSLAKRLIEISTTYQEIEESIQEFTIKKRKKRIKASRLVKYWGIIAIMDNRKIKVILRKIGDNGNLHFWSIVPAWTTNKYRDAKFITTMKGKPEED